MAVLLRVYTFGVDLDSLRRRVERSWGVQLKNVQVLIGYLLIWVCHIRQNLKRCAVRAGHAIRTIRVDSGDDLYRLNHVLDPSRQATER